MTISKKQLAEAEHAAYSNGYHTGMDHGLAKGKAAAERDNKQLRIEAFIKLVNACGQAMNVQSTMLASLAAALDEARGL